VPGTAAEGRWLWHNQIVKRPTMRATTLDMLMGIGTASSLVFAGLALLAARWGVFELDRDTHTLVGFIRHTAFDGPMATVSLLGQSTALAPLIVLASCLLWRSSPRWALALPLVMAGTGALQFLAKWAVDRPRPNAAPWGFPSGHALSVLVFFGVIAYLVWTSRTRRCWRCAVAGLCVTTVLVVGFSRLYLDMHWLSDVGGGYAVGLAYLLLAIWLVERIPVPLPSLQPSAQRSSKPAGFFRVI
jgi:membrane-associated phospholipid phosphatase